MGVGFFFFFFLVFGVGFWGMDVVFTGLSGSGSNDCSRSEGFGSVVLKFSSPSVLTC